MSAISLVLMPRVYGHAHLASLETITNLTCTAAVIFVAHRWNGPAPPAKRAAILAGILFGLALLTKIQAILIPIPLICWAVWRWRSNAIVPLALWGIAAVVVFFAGWPYLWDAPVAHTFEYLGRTTNRATIHVWYFGQKYADTDVPWHYPFVMFALTVPAVLHATGLIGLFRGITCQTKNPPESTCTNAMSDTTTGQAAKRGSMAPVESRGELERSRDALLLSTALFPLIVFALPGIAVYDGERLFLTSFPLWAFFIGRGWCRLWNLLRRWSNSRLTAGIVCSILLLVSASPLIMMAPCHVSYYNEVTPFLTGTGDRSGLEIDYWGAGMTRRLLVRLAETVPEGEAVAITPTLHQFQADDFNRQSPVLRSRRIRIVEYQPESSTQMYILAYRRLADLPDNLDGSSTSVEVLETTTRSGRPLAYILKRSQNPSQTSD